MLFSARVVPSPAAMCAQQVSNTEPGEQCGAVVALLGGTGRYQTKVTIEDSGSLNSCIRIEHQRKQSVIPLSRRRAAVDARQDALEFRALRDIRQVPPARPLKEVSPPVAAYPYYSGAPRSGTALRYASPPALHCGSQLPRSTSSDVRKLPILSVLMSETASFNNIFPLSAA